LFLIEVGTPDPFTIHHYLDEGPLFATIVTVSPIETRDDLPFAG